MTETEILYTKVDELIGKEPIYFLNHGYAPAYEEFDDVNFKHQLSLYKKAVEHLDLDNKSMLEVGCGRGGGSKWIADTYNVQMYACDITPANISVCKLNEKENLIYAVSAAENISYKDESMDAIFSIEASQAFEDLGIFFKKAHQALKHGGSITMVDMYPIEFSDRNRTMKDLATYISYVSIFFKDIKLEIITDSVKQAMLEDIELTPKYIKDSKTLFYSLENIKQNYKRYDNLEIGYFKLTANKI